MLKNLAALGMENVEHAHSIARLNQLLRSDYRGLIVSTIHKFRDMPADLNPRRNIYVLVDEAHRTTGGDLGNYLMAALPNATYFGFTGTPIHRTAYGQVTFKTFGVDDAVGTDGTGQGYLHKYSIRESIEDGTTLPLFYNLAPNELRIPAEQKAEYNTKVINLVKSIEKAAEDAGRSLFSIFGSSAILALHLVLLFTA